MNGRLTLCEIVVLFPGPIDLRENRIKQSDCVIGRYGIIAERRPIIVGIDHMSPIPHGIITVFKTADSRVITFEVPMEAELLHQTNSTRHFQ